MKSKKIIILENILRFMAVAVLLRHKPKIVAITGSVGKTSTKTAVFEVLSSKFFVRENQKNYNNEIGIPLTIIGSESGGNNLLKWMWILVKWFFVLLNPKYPEILILELGVDRPGDMEHFMSFIHPDISIVTNVSSSHLEFFKTIENIAKEKRTIVEALEKNGTAVLNGDDQLTLAMEKRTNANVVTFGLSESSTISASNVIFNYQDEKLEGISFKLNYDGKNIPIRLRHILATHTTYAALAAAAVGISFKMNLVDIAAALENLRSPLGRMNLLDGINGSYIIDDTYNASPISTIAALDVLGNLKSKRKIAVLGDMLELGDEEQNGHREVGKKVVDSGIDVFVGVGRRMEHARSELVSLGFSEKNILTFPDPESAARKVAEIVEPGDFILVKGSQGMRMEKVVEAVLRDKDSMEKLLCRQYGDWKRKPFGNP